MITNDDVEIEIGMKITTFVDGNGKKHRGFHVQNFDGGHVWLKKNFEQRQALPSQLFAKRMKKIK